MLRECARKVFAAISEVAVAAKLGAILTTNGCSTLCILPSFIEVLKNVSLQVTQGLVSALWLVGITKAAIQPRHVNCSSSKFQDNIDQNLNERGPEYTGVELFLMSIVQYMFCFENYTTKKRG